MAMRAEREEVGCPIDHEDFRARTQTYFQSHIPDGSFIAFLAIEERAVVGTGGLCLHHVPPTYGNPSGKVAYLVNMYVVPEYRGRGIAAGLLEHLMDEAKSLGCDRVALNTSKAGRPVYEKYGFTDVPGEMEFYLD